jgi:hypothetical protein
MLLTLMAVTATATSGFGHPPSGMTARFDTDEHLLTVTVMHSVKDAAKHYIDEIEVDLNGKQMIKQQFNRQTDMKLQEVVYKVIDARVGDKIKVTADCNISGKKSLEITVEKKVEEEGEAETETQD